jgi:hypothetical protein
MANILSLALRVTADASQLKLDPVQRALVGLGDQADKLTGQFDKFASGSAGAARAQEEFARRSQDLINNLRDGGGATQFAAAFEKLAEEARAAAAAFEEGARVTEANRTVEERRAIEIERLNRLLNAGAIEQETYNRAIAEASGANAAAAEAERERVAALAASEALLAEAERQRAAVLQEGARVTQQFATAEEQRAARLQRIQELLAQGAISEEIAARATAEASGANEAAAKAEQDRAAALAAASRIIQANLTPQERYDTQIQELQSHLDAGRLSQEQFNRAAEKAKTDLDKVGQAATKTDKNVESLAKNVRLLSVIEIGRLIVDGLQTIGNVISGALNQVSAFVSRISSAFDSFNDLSARTGIGVEALQGYSLAAKLAGVDTEAFGTAVQRLAVNIGKATPGDTLDKSLRSINLSVAELRGLAPEQQFSAISNAISGLPTAADRAAAAVEIFGKQGAALAPLFREGAASIEELRDRAQRLGVIVDETQISNIAAMNDAFDLARATVEGIAGQVIGNLAPAVTAVVDQFLKFIEEWSGAEGRGGTGIANAISEILLDGAQVLADVFDSLTGYLANFSVGFDQIAKTFSVVGNVLIAASESFRAVFNFFQTVVSFLTERLGRFLEGLGSWVSSDLQEFGKNLADAAREQGVQNARQLEDAAKNAAGAFNRALDGGSGSTQQAGAGVAARFMTGVRAQFERERSPNFKIESNIESTGERLTRFIETVGEGADKFYLDSVKTLEVFEQQAAAGGLTADQIEIMNGFMQKLNGQLDQEVAKRQEAAEAAEKQASEIDAIVAASEQQARIDKEFGGNPARAKAADNLLKIQQEIVRVEEQIRLAREAGDQSTLDSLTGRLATLDQVASREQDIAAGRAKAGKEAAKDTESELERIEKQIAQSRSALLDRQFEIELARAEELATVRTGSVEINDIRSGGISAFFDTLKEDPAITEAKKQTAELEKMRREIAKLNADKVDILAGTG